MAVFQNSPKNWRSTSTILSGLVPSQFQGEIIKQVADSLWLAVTLTLALLHLPTTAISENLHKSSSTLRFSIFWNSPNTHNLPHPFHSNNGNDSGKPIYLAISSNDINLPCPKSNEWHEWHLRCQHCDMSFKQADHYCIRKTTVDWIESIKANCSEAQIIEILNTSTSFLHSLLTKPFHDHRVTMEFDLWISHRNNCFCHGLSWVCTHGYIASRKFAEKLLRLLVCQGRTLLS